MTEREAQELLDKIVGQVLGYQNVLSLEQFMQKFTFDVRLPQPVVDATDGSRTWSQSVNPVRFVSMIHARELEIAGAGPDTDFLRPARRLSSVDDIMAAWNEVNFTTSERLIDSLNVAQSDNIYFSENVFRSQDVRKSKNVLFTDGLDNSEFIVAGQRSANSTFCIRLEDSTECTNSFNVAWSARLTNCLFMQDSADMQDSMFCSNVKGKRFCVANMQYDEAEYRRLRDIVVRWILS